MPRTSDLRPRRTKRIDNASVTNDFGYNIRSEVIEALMGTNTYGYAYDPIGNRLSASNNTESLTYLANALNQYTNITDGATVEPQYDADGNMVSNGAWTFTWNGENRLVAASNATTVIENKYDYMGRRITKTTTSTGDTCVAHFLYDGWAMIRETKGQGLGTILTNSYVYGIDLSGSMQGAGTIGGLLSMTVAGVGDPGHYYYFYDANGNVTDLVDTNGSSVAHYEYGPFGQTITKTGTLADANPFRFSTKYLDGDVDLYYYGLRYYSPEQGRWPSRDPIGELGRYITSKGNQMGRGIPVEPDIEDGSYTFVFNDPLLSIDQFGLHTLRSAADQWATRWRCAHLGGSRLRSCQRRHWRGLSDETKFRIWYWEERMSGTSWTSSLWKCPKKLCLRLEGRLVGDMELVLTPRAVNPDSLKWFDPGPIIRPWVERYHPGAVYEMRSRTTDGHSNQCTYDTEGNLITDPPACGTADFVSPADSRLRHMAHDVKPIELAARLDSCWGGFPARITCDTAGENMRKYYEVRPPIYD